MNGSEVNLDNNVIPLKSKPKPINSDSLREMTLSNWGKELCYTHLKRLELPEITIQHQISELTDEQTEMIGNAVLTCIDKCLELIKSNDS